jgi:hypothetical protein
MATAPMHLINGLFDCHRIYLVKALLNHRGDEIVDLARTNLRVLR